MKRRILVEGRNAVVTGGSRGLGLEIARELVRRGAHVAIVARDPIELERAARDLRGRSPRARVLAVPCDLENERELRAMLEIVRAEHGPIEVLVNNAGAIQVGPLDTMTVADFERAMSLHCFVPLRLTLGVREEMRARGGGRIANIASIGGVVAMPHLLPYSASKFALMGLSQGMHAELARDGIVVSTIAPGLMRTGSPRNATFKGNHKKEYAWFAIGDSMPILSMSSTRAARRIVDAIEKGEAHVVLGLPAKVALLANGLFPGLIARAMTVVNWLLPKGQDRTSKLGKDSESFFVPSVLTTATERAAVRNNET